MQKKLIEISFFLLFKMIKNYSISLMNLSASNAAMQPVHAEVIA
jgi:hypothetical protein